MSRPTARKEKIQGTEMTAATQHSLHTKDLVHEIFTKRGALNSQYRSTGSKWMFVFAFCSKNGA